MSASIPAHTAYSGNTSYTYDSKDQLTQESSTRAGGYTNNFTLDSAGNATSFKGTSHSYNSNNQDTGNSYDGNGNPTTYQGSTCTFDPENRMTAFGSALTATYRGDGLRAKAVTSAGTTYFLYDREVLLAEMNSSGSLTAVNTVGTEGMVSRTSSGGTSFHTFDPEGNVVQRLNSSGGVVTTHDFDSMGAGVGTGTGDPLANKGAIGYYGEIATGLCVLAHRYYDPSTGRFLTRDPIGPRGGINVYSHVANSPTSRADPTGLAIWKQNKDHDWQASNHDFITFERPGCSVIWPSGSRQYPFFHGTYRSFGFWPMAGEGEDHNSDIAFPDPESRTSNRKFDYVSDDNPDFESNLCLCIQMSIFANPSWGLVNNNCGSWVGDMWDCATMITYGPNGRPVPPRDPGEIDWQFLPN